MKLELLNSENMSEVIGGGVMKCNTAGDTIFKECAVVKKVIIHLCATYEASCRGSFTFNCGLADMGCSGTFSLKPI